MSAYLRFWKLLWICQMAWRDARGSSRRLFVFVLPLCVGVAVIVAGGSLRQSFDDQITEQSRALIGADAALISKVSFAPQTSSLLEKFGIARLSETRFRAMASFSTGENQLVTVRAVESGFPPVGSLSKDAALKVHEDLSAIVDRSLFAATTNPQSITLGSHTFRVSGPSDFNPGGSQRDAFIASPVFIPLAELPSTGLPGEGGIVDFVYHLSLPPDLNGHLPEEIEAYAKQNDIRVTTIEKRAEFLGKIADSVGNYFSLFGLSVLLLAALGTSAALLFYLQSKQGSAAILRCMGISPRAVTAIFTVQVLGAGLLAAVIGALFGEAMFLFLQIPLSSLSDVEYTATVYWRPVSLSLLVCTLVILLTAYPALVGISRVAPFAVFRQQESVTRSLARPLVWGMVLLSLLAFATASGVPLKTAASYTIGLSTVAIIFVLATRLLTLMLRLVASRTRPFPLRHGLRNIYRPRNQTTELLLVLGISILLVNVVITVQQVVQQQIAMASNPDRPNVFIFDVQTDQVSTLEGILGRENLQVMRREPIVLMRLSRLKDRDIEQVIADPQLKADSWQLRREYWVSYRDHLVSNERVVQGEFTGKVPANTPRIPISVDKRLADSLGLKLGDEVEFSLQGTPILTTIGSLREIFWQQMERNSFVIFPEGALNGVPQSSFVATKATSEQLRALRKAVTAELPNISLLDLQSIIARIDGVLSGIRLILIILAVVMAVTTVLVILSTLVSSRSERGHEVAVLKTLGATRRQVFMITVIEYGVIGSATGLAALTLSLLCGRLLRTYVFELPDSGVVYVVLTTVLCVCVQTLLATFLAGRLQRSNTVSNLVG